MIISSPGESVLRAGTEVPLRILETLNSNNKSLREGARVRMEVAQSVMLGSGGACGSGCDSRTCGCDWYCPVGEAAAAAMPGAWWTGCSSDVMGFTPVTASAVNDYLVFLGVFAIALSGWPP